MSMTTSEIIEEIAEKVDHTYSTESILRKVNYLQDEIFRLWYKVSAASVQDLVGGTAKYSLDYPISSIIQLLVNDVEYEYRNLFDHSDCSFYYGIDDGIGLYPTPSEDVSNGLIIVHNKSPYKLLTSDMDKSPDLDGSYHMLLVYGVLREISDSNKYDLLFQSMLKDLRRANQLPITFRAE